MGSLLGKTILVLDDQPLMREMVRHAVTKEGGRCIEAETVAQAMDAAIRQLPHLLIVDLVLEEETGFDFLEQRQKQTELRAIPVIVVSGQQDLESVRKAANMGAREYVLKPWKPALLLLKVQKLLQPGPFTHVEFAVDDRPTVTAKLACKVTSANETGMLVEGPLRLATESSLKLDWPRLRDLGCAEARVRTSPLLGVLKSQGVYVNELNLIGIERSTADRIRKEFGA